MPIAALLGLIATVAFRSAEPLLAEMRQVEPARNAAIRDGDAAALERLHAADFRGIAAAAGRSLLDVFRRNAGAGVAAESKATGAREVGGLMLVEGRLGGAL